MGWKSLPTWLKGAIIFVILDIILIIFAYLSSSPGEGVNLTLNLFQIPLTFFTQRLQNNFIVIIGGLISYFIIGSIIGWIISKIKSKK